jgi:hypothetical protein
MGNYRKKSVDVQVEARQWDGTAMGASHIIDWVLNNGGSMVYECGPDGCSKTDAGHSLVLRGDKTRWTCQPRGYVILKPGIGFSIQPEGVFLEGYEPVEVAA